MYVFVYGTLKRGFINHSILEKILVEKDYLEVKTLGKYPMYKSESYFPYLEDREGYGKNVKGHLCKIRPEDKWRLDQFEGVPTLYKEGQIDVVDEKGNKYESVQVYFRTKNKENIELAELMEEWIEEDPRENLQKRLNDYLN